MVGMVVDSPQHFQEMKQDIILLSAAARVELLVFQAQPQDFLLLIFLEELAVVLEDINLATLDNLELMADRLAVVAVAVALQTMASTPGLVVMAATAPL
jgi:hypothetical protein